MTYARLRASLYQAVRMRHRYPWRPAGVAVAAIALGWLIAALGWTTNGAKTVGVGVVLLTVVTGWWLARHVARPHTTKALVERRSELDQRSGGVATPLDIAELASPAALRLQARVLRPSTTAQLSWWGRRRMAPTELGVLVAKLGWGLRWQAVWSSIEDATLRIGGPRMGKTITLAPYGLTAPGALITTSTRLDLARAVHAVRLQHGPVHFFNPSNLGGVPSTLRWRVLDGCEEYATASRRASDLIPKSEGEHERWDTQARRILAILLHAAGRSGRTMGDVIRWSSGSGEGNLKEILDGLLDTGPAARERINEIRAFWATNDRTRSSITTTMAIPLSWMSDDRARELGDAEPDDPSLVNITEIISRGQTLHLLGHEQHGTFSPLIGALVAEIAHAARVLGEAQPGGRLDPPLTFLLDEAAIVVPVPLDQWTADMGGRGATFHISVQSLAQMRARWGEQAANALLANIACFVVFGGSAIHDDLADISSLTGTHRMKVVGTDQPSRTRPSRRIGRRDDRDRGERSQTLVDDDHEAGQLRGEFRWVPVLSPAQIRALQPGQVLVLRRNLPAVVGWAPKLTDRRHQVVPLPRTDAEAVAQLEAMLAARSVVTPSQALLAAVRGLVARIPALTGLLGRTAARRRQAVAAAALNRRGSAQPDEDQDGDAA